MTNESVNWGDKSEPIVQQTKAKESEGDASKSWISSPKCWVSSIRTQV